MFRMLLSTRLDSCRDGVGAVCMCLSRGPYLSRASRVGGRFLSLISDVSRRSPSKTKKNPNAEAGKCWGRSKILRSRAAPGEVYNFLQ